MAETLLTRRSRAEKAAKLIAVDLQGENFCKLKWRMKIYRMIE